MFERFTSQARTVVVRARDESRRLQHGHVGTEHLLLGMLDPDAGTVAELLRDAGVDPAGIRDAIARLQPAPRTILSDEEAEALRTVGIDVDAVLARIEASFGPDAVLAAEPGRWGRRRPRWGRDRGRRSGGRSRVTPRVRKVLELSLREAIRLRHDSIGGEHLLLGMLREGHGLGVRILADAGVDLDLLRATTTAALRRAA
jgi:ATP-dependent Clp protease ATP-binding subunit ClpA